MTKKISVIIPCCDEEESLPLLYAELCKVADDMLEHTFEFVFVNDGSTDRTLKMMKTMSAEDDRIHYISFSRNFGKEAAIYAGLKKSTGDYVVLIDADLQDPPHMIKQMYDTLVNEECDCVAARREGHKRNRLLYAFLAKHFYKLINRISETNVVDGARDFRMMTRQMTDAVLEMAEYNRFAKGIFGWVGFDTQWISYQSVERIVGRSKWSLLGLFLYSLEAIIGFSTRPLYIASAFGILFCLIAFVMICVIIVKTLIWNDPVQGYPSTICLIFFIGGVQLFCLGILGQYLAKTYMETKKRPIYIVKEEN